MAEYEEDDELPSVDHGPLNEGRGKNTLATFKQHSEKAVDYIGLFITDQKLKNLKFFGLKCSK